jgi:hypothetical protein
MMLSAWHALQWCLNKVLALLLGRHADEVLCIKMSMLLLLLLTLTGSSSATVTVTSSDSRTECLPMMTGWWCCAHTSSPRTSSTGSIPGGDAATKTQCDHMQPLLLENTVWLAPKGIVLVCTHAHQHAWNSCPCC